MNMENKVFFEDGFDGEAVGGFFIRNDIFKFFKKLKETGLNPVGIKIDDGWNLEVIVERNQSYIDNYEKKIKETK